MAVAQNPATGQAPRRANATLRTEFIAPFTSIRAIKPLRERERWGSKVAEN